MPRPQRTMPTEMNDTLNEFSNPEKRNGKFDDFNMNDEDDDDEGPGSFGDGSTGIGGEDGSGGGRDDQSYDEFDDGPIDEGVEEVVRPSEGYRSLEEEKSDLLFKLSRYRKQGHANTRQFTVHSDIRDLRAELNRIRTEQELEGSIKMSRRILMAVVSGMEYANRRWNSPLDLQLDGWSEQVMESIGDYDRVFEKLYFKYKNRVSMPPEMELLMLISGSAMMFHLTNSMFKAAMPQVGEVIRQNPELVQSMAKAFANTAQQRADGQARQQQPMGGDDDGKRREMKGPGMDFGAMFGGLGGLGGLGGMGGFPGMGMMGSNGGGAGVVPPRPPAPTRSTQIEELDPVKEAIKERDGMSDRLSDVISEDLESVPDDLDSLMSDDDGKSDKRGVKNIRIETSPGRKSKKSKNVVVI